MALKNKGKLAIVLGGCGFIGNALVGRLLNEDYQRIVVVDDLSSGHRNLLPDDKRIDFFMEDASRVHIADIGQADVVHYLCASPFVPDSFEDPKDTRWRNVGVLKAFLENNAAALPRRFVIASSGEVYGNVQEGHANEDREPDNVFLLSPYGQSRIDAERVLADFASRHKQPYVALRLFNTIGPAATQPYFVPEMIRQLERAEVVRHGNLNPIRDFVWIGDTVEAFVAAAAAQPQRGYAINVCTGRGWTMLDILDRLQALADGPPLRRVLDQSRVRSRELHRLVGDPRRAADKLHWSAQVGIEEALRLTYDSYRESKTWPYEKS